MSTTVYTGYLYADYKTGAVFVDSEPCSAQRLVIRLGPNGVTDGIQVVVSKLYPLMYTDRV